jgi:drug/metabolite transporter (DMT)-like permease
MIISRFYWFLIFIGVFLSALGGLMLKMGAVEINYTQPILQSFLELLKNWKLALGIVFYTIPVFIWIYILKKMPLSEMQPLFALIYVVTPLLAMLFLKEQVSLVRWCGIGIIIFGITVFANG